VPKVVAGCTAFRVQGLGLGLGFRVYSARRG